MSFVGSLLGTAGGAGGTGFDSPTGVNQSQIDQSYKNAQDTFKQQQDFTNALQAQNGIGNQSAVFNQLSQIAQGQGPNPAQAMLNQATSANIANQGALMAGQRGSSSNPGLIARQAAQQGGSLQQQAAGQGATMQANQSLGTINQMGQLATNQVNQVQTGLQNQGNQANATQSNLLGLQGNMNQANASMANTRMGGQANLLGNIMGGIGSAFNLAEGGPVPHYADGNIVQQMPQSDPFMEALRAGQPPSMPAPQAPIAPTQQNGPRSKVGQQFSSQKPMLGSQDYFATGQAGKDLGAGIRSLFAPKETGVYNMSDSDTKDAYAQANIDMGREMLKADPSDAMGPRTKAQEMAGSEEKLPAMEMGMPMAAHGGKVPAMVSPGEKYLSPKDVKKVEKGASPMQVGETIPGKAKVKGAKNSYANDTVPKTLEEGGIVLPRSVTQSKHPHWAAHRFVSQIMAKQGKLPPKASKK